MPSNTSFRKLNDGWNAEPNAPSPTVRVDGEDVVVEFLLNPWQFVGFSEGQFGHIRFRRACRYRLGQLNDEGWARGQSRFSRDSHHWGQFYELSGDLRFAECPDDWVLVPSLGEAPRRHFLFYFRDQDLECDAEDWMFSPTPAPVSVA